MDAIGDDKIENIVVMSVRPDWQNGNAVKLIGYHIDQEPAPMLVVQPTLDMAATFSRDGWLRCYATRNVYPAK